MIFDISVSFISCWHLSSAILAIVIGVSYNQYKQTNKQTKIQKILNYIKLEK